MRDSYKSHSDIHHYDTRNKKHLIPYCRLARCQKIPHCVGLKLYNALPSGLRDLHFTVFKCRVRVLLAEDAFFSVVEFFWRCLADADGSLCNCEIVSRGSI